jgi:hypothetical protein
MAVVLGSRSRADRLSRAFARAVAPEASLAPSGARLLGLEHEFRVLVGNRQVDFGRLLHDLSIPGRRVDPADPNAYRGAWGGAITADDREAEIAVAPVEWRPGCPAELVARARLGRSLLAASLPPEARLEGFSTHLSVAIPDRLGERAARIYARTFAPALMLLLDGPESPGLLVRPRPGRLELGGEFVDGERLRAVAAFAAGSVRVAARAARRRPFAGRGLPASIRVAIQPAIDRHGWFVARDAFGADLYATGRATPLRLGRGGFVDAGTHLGRCWAIARAAIADLFSAEDLAAADRFVAGQAPLGIDGSQAEAIAFLDAGPPAAGASPFARAVAERRRPGFRVTPALVSWDFVVLRLDDDEQVAFACLPRRALGSGLEALDDGRLDDLLRGYLAAAADGGGRLLASSRQTAAAGLYGAVGRAADLLAPERPSLGPGGDRPGKRRRDDRPDRRPQHRPEPRPHTGAGMASGTASVGARFLGLPAGIAAAAAGLLVVAAVAAAVVLGGGAPASTPTPLPTGAATPTAVAAATASPAPSSTASATPTVAPVPIPDPSCAREPDLKSITGKQAKDVTFVNRLGIAVQTLWLDYQGKRVFYRQIAPGGSYSQATWVSHPWIVADLQGTCLLLVVTDANLDTVTVGP